MNLLKGTGKDGSECSGRRCEDKRRIVFKLLSENEIDKKLRLQRLFYTLFCGCK